MKVEITRTSFYSDWVRKPEASPCLGAVFENGKWIMKINTMKALAKFIEQVNEEIIVSVIDGQMIIEIYDNYRE